MSLRTLQAQLAKARVVVRNETFGTAAWEAAMVRVRALADQVNAAMPVEEYCSIDSGVHRTRLGNGKLV